MSNDYYPIKKTEIIVKLRYLISSYDIHKIIIWKLEKMVNDYYFITYKIFIDM